MNDANTSLATVECSSTTNTLAKIVEYTIPNRRPDNVLPEDGRIAMHSARHHGTKQRGDGYRVGIDDVDRFRCHLQRLSVLAHGNTVPVLTRRWQIQLPRIFQLSWIGRFDEHQGKKDSKRRYNVTAKINSETLCSRFWVHVRFSRQDRNARPA